jgi:two-component system response regulator
MAPKPFNICSGSAVKTIKTRALLDLKLPRLDGLQVLERIRSHPATRLLPVVILTTSGQEEDLHKSYALGASSFVRKPLSYSELIKVASFLVTYWLTINEVPCA